MYLKGHSDWGMFLGPGRKQTSLLSARRAKEEPNNKPVSLTSIPEKMMEQILLEAISKQMKDKKVIESNQHGFMKRK